MCKLDWSCLFSLKITATPSETISKSEKVLSKLWIPGKYLFRLNFIFLSIEITSDLRLWPANQNYGFQGSISRSHIPYLWQPYPCNCVLLCMQLLAPTAALKVVEWNRKSNFFNIHSSHQCNRCHWGYVEVIRKISGGYFGNIWGIY